MVRRRSARSAVEPERRNLREHLALVGDAGAEHVVERRDAIGGDDQQAVAEVVEVADLALAIGRAAGERGVENGCGERATDFLVPGKARILQGTAAR